MYKNDLTFVALFVRPIPSVSNNARTHENEKTDKFPPGNRAFHRENVRQRMTRKVSINYKRNLSLMHNRVNDNRVKYSGLVSGRRF